MNRFRYQVNLWLHNELGPGLSRKRNKLQEMFSFLGVHLPDLRRLLERVLRVAVPRQRLGCTHFREVVPHYLVPWTGKETGVPLDNRWLWGENKLGEVDIRDCVSKHI